MKKIVVCWTIGGGYECGSYLMIRCCEYEDVESYLIDFRKELLRAIEAKSFEFWFNGQLFNTDNFVTLQVIFLPEVHELNDWFEKVMVLGGDCDNIVD